MAFLGGSADSTTTALEALVTCPCGHTIGLHDGAGCHRCQCRANRDDVLDADIGRARREGGVGAEGYSGRAIGWRS